MSTSHWDQRFFGSTRGQIVALLRRASRTVEELAQALSLTDNGVRAHLATLERDGLVQQRGVRRGGGKPAYVYELTPEGERLFPKADGPVLRSLLDLLAERLEPEQLETLLRAAGQRIAAAQPGATGDTRARLELAVETLNALGGLAELEEGSDSLVIRGYRCPLADIVPGHPEACHLAEALLCELTGLPFQEHCDRTELHCCFEAQIA